MALDVFVMPLWRFKTGDFVTAVERLVGPGKVQIVSGDGISVRRRFTGFFARRRARKEVSAIAAAVAAANGRPCDWRDDGPVVYSEQFHTDAIRAYLYWRDRRDIVPRLDPPPNGNYAEHLVDEVAPERPARGGHLQGHSLYSGYLLPCDFDRIVKVEPYLIFGTWPAHRDVGSAYRIRSESQALARDLGLPDDAEVPYEWSEDDPLAAVKSEVSQLREIVELSWRYHLPVIFWG